MFLLIAWSRAENTAVLSKRDNIFDGGEVKNNKLPYPINSSNSIQE